MQTVTDFYIVVFFHFMLHYVCTCMLLLLASLSFNCDLSIFNKRIYLYCIVNNQDVFEARAFTASFLVAMLYITKH